MSLPVEKVFVVHVSSDIKREKHITNELRKFNIDFEFMLQMDVEEISEGVIKRYFSGEEMINAPASIQSCALKHILIYKKIVEEGIDTALIFEDDIFLDENFDSSFSNYFSEYQQLGNNEKDKALVNFEDSMLVYVPKSQLKTGQHLYRMNEGRCAGAYLINRNLAKSILDEINRNKCDLPIDWYHNALTERIGLQHYWSHPAIAKQGSHTGKMKSMLDGKKKGLYQQFKWAVSSWLRRSS
jgi:GR25 family glycosyltransferase involved in LPS biosynthesis